MIMPMLREMRAEISARFDGVERRLDAVDRRFEKLEADYKTFHQAMTADTLLSKLVTGEFEERIPTLERKMASLEKSS
jgi:hypothetical protein